MQVNQDKLVHLEKLFFILLLGFLSYFSIYWGPSTDEIHQQPYGKKSYDFYKTFTKDDSVTRYKIGDFDELMMNYGALVDTVPEFFNDVTGFDLFILRHMVFAFFGFLLYLFGYKLAKEIGGNYKYGLFALALLLIQPRLTGELFNNPKDLPFAGAYMAGLYYIYMIVKNFPDLSRGLLVKTALAFGLTMTIRIGGLLLFFYLGLAILIRIFSEKELRDKYIIKFQELKLIAIKIGGVFILAYLIAILFWPPALYSPFKVPYEAFTVFSKFPVTVRTLFDGKWIQSDQVPPSYVFKYMMLTVTEVVFAGLFLGFIAWKKYDKIKKIGFYILVLAAIFPIVVIMYKKSSLYNGWRQEYFTLPPLVVIASVFWSKIIIDNFSNIKGKLLGILFLALLALPISFMFKNFPHFYVYFNHLSGGIDKNYAEYEMDYYGHSVNEATFWIKKNHPDWLQNTNVKLASNVPYNMQKIMDRWNFKNYPAYVRYRERYDSDWDIGVFSPAFVDPEIMKNGYFKSKDVIHAINIDDKPIGIIIKRQDKNDFYGKRALDSNNFPKAIEYLNKALQYDPNNEIAWTNLGFAQLNANQPNEAVKSLSNALKISPESMMAKTYLAYAYLQSGNLPYAQSVLMNLIEENPNMPDPYRLLAQIYQQQGNGAMAQQYMHIYQQITGQMGSQ